MLDRSRLFHSQSVIDPPIKQYLLSRTLFGGILLMSLVCLLALSSRNFLFRFVQDPRHEISIVALDAALKRFPGSALLNRLRSQRYLREAGLRANRLEEARAHAEQAVRAAPWDYRGHLLAGTIAELMGDREAAVDSLRMAVRRAPTLVEPNWALANLLLRQGDLSAALVPLRQAVQAHEWLFPAACDLLWRAARPENALVEADSGTLEKLLLGLTGGDPRQHLLLANFLLDRGEVDLAIWSYRQIPLGERRQSTQGAQWLSRLIDRGEAQRGRQLWGELRGVADPTNLPLLWNGGFEEPPDPILPHYEWQFKSSEFAQVGIDPRVNAEEGEGRRSLRLLLTGRDTTRLDSEVRQRLVLPPGSRYRLSFLVQTRDLLTPGGPQLAIRWNGRVLAASDPLPDGTTEGWQSRSFDFQAPSEDGTAEIVVVRTPKFSYDAPSRGVIWLDDVRLTLLEAGAAPLEGGQP